jgi:hypothetical protein
MLNSREVCLSRAIAIAAKVWRHPTIEAFFIMMEILIRVV